MSVSAAAYQDEPPVDHLRPIVERRARQIAEIDPHQARRLWPAIEQARRERVPLAKTIPSLFADGCDVSLRTAALQLLDLISRLEPARAHAYDADVAAILDPQQPEQVSER
jgi:hypothetical protein